MNPFLQACPAAGWTACRPGPVRTAGAVVAVVLALTCGCHRKSATPETPTSAASTVSLLLSTSDVARVTSERLETGVRVVGTLNPAVRVEVKSRMSEELESVLVDRGTVVTQGQVLAQLDDRTPRAELNRIRSRLAAAERDFRAAEILFKGGAMSERSFSNAKVAVDSANSDLTEAEQALAHATIRSPIDGVISDRAVSVGESVSPGQILFTVVNSSDLECAVSVLPADASSVRRGQRAILRLVAYGGREYLGEVARMDPLADPTSRRVGVYIRLPNPDGQVVAGLFCTGTILTNAAALDREALFVPRAAVRQEKDERVVYTVAEGHLKRVPVEAAAEENVLGLIQVFSGLSAGDTVLLSGTQEVRDGLPVELPKSATKAQP